VPKLFSLAPQHEQPSSAQSRNCHGVAQYLLYGLPGERSELGPEHPTTTSTALTREDLMHDSISHLNPSEASATGAGTKDGSGAGDCDAPFFGFRQYQFSARQTARLLLLRAAVLDARIGVGRYVGDVAAE
jgi:hypothetical protein